MLPVFYGYACHHSQLNGNSNNNNNNNNNIKQYTQTEKLQQIGQIC